MEVYYTRQELLDYLPGGWALSDPSSAGAWDAEQGRWEVAVRDSADVEWELAVTGKSAAANGRVEALKSAIDKLYKSALGKSSWFG